MQGSCGLQAVGCAACSVTVRLQPRCMELAQGGAGDTSTVRTWWACVDACAGHLPVWMRCGWHACSR
eukprot:358140-Chlamydomonas_euryale.AAC.2